ncbi:hypothetical protein I7I51_06747 [Histoplasma capsulatum]|uniref:Uncharacterized protein n=1 Tax=Ajellomyces capsulatus TaxID=5037 RepID=A0A8A1MHE4_AJECA|nr:hypothetical protein I7I51_06747 [Histoplasma capsulatum]
MMREAEEQYPAILLYGEKCRQKTHLCYITRNCQNSVPRATITPCVTATTFKLVEMVYPTTEYEKPEGDTDLAQVIYIAWSTGVVPDGYTLPLDFFGNLLDKSGFRLDENMRLLAAATVFCLARMTSIERQRRQRVVGVLCYGEKLQGAEITNTDFLGSLPGRDCGFDYNSENQGHSSSKATSIAAKPSFLHSSKTLSRCILEPMARGKRFCPAPGRIEDNSKP